MGLEDFDLGSELGHGSYSTVFKATRRQDGKTYALKRVAMKSMTPALLRSTLNEVRLLCSFRHGRLLRCYEAFLTSDQQYLFVVLEYCGLGDLGDKIKRYRKRRQYIDERVVWVYVIEIIEGLKALHDKGVIHRDIKASNVFVTSDGSVKIGDFNVSKVMRDSMAKTQIGTPYYMSPEIWQDQQYDAATDIWSLGCLAYELCTLKHPFQAKDAHNLKAVVLEGSYTPLPAIYSEELGVFIDSMLRMDPLERPSATDLLEHESIRRRMDMVKTPLVHSALDPPELLATITAPDEVAAIASMTELGFPSPSYDADPDPPYDAPTQYSRPPREYSSDDRASVTPQGMRDVAYSRRVSSVSCSEREDTTSQLEEDGSTRLPELRRGNRSPNHRTQSSGYSRQRSTSSSTTTTTITTSPRHNNSTTHGKQPTAQSPSEPDLAAVGSAPSLSMPSIHKSASTPNTIAEGETPAANKQDQRSPTNPSGFKSQVAGGQASFGKFASFFGFGGGGSSSSEKQPADKPLDKPAGSSASLPPITSGVDAPQSPSRSSTSHGGKGHRERSESSRSTSTTKPKGASS